MTFYDRRPRWKRAVLNTPSLTASTKLVMIVLLDHMDNLGKVTYPVREVAADLGIRNSRRVSDRISEAHKAGYLITVTSAVHGRTAEYQATIPSDQQTGSLEDPSEGPANRVTRNRVTTPGFARNRVTSITTTSQPGTVSDDKRQRDECDWCSSHGCPQCDPTEGAM